MSQSFLYYIMAIGIVEKAQETSSDTGTAMHNIMCLCNYCYVNSGCVLECRETPTSQVTMLSLYI